MKLKSEIRNAKPGIRDKYKKRKVEKPKPAERGAGASLLPSGFEFVSDFEFRIRDLT
jgi:hypothetical protein